MMTVRSFRTIVSPFLAEDDEDVERVSQSVPSDMMSPQGSTIIRDVIYKEEEDDDEDDEAGESGMRGGEEGSESREAEEEEGEPSEVCGASSDSQQPSHSSEPPPPTHSLALLLKPSNMKAAAAPHRSPSPPESLYTSPQPPLHPPPPPSPPACHTHAGPLTPSHQDSISNPRFKSWDPHTQRQSSQLRRPSVGRGPQLTPGIGSMQHFFDDDDRMVPSTPTLVVPHRTDGFAEAIQ
ncbi:hypothetical protein F7725_012058 [Dissostichus mawsoni]|uniref:Uncharacterized protein n=1 Tax=Dissostichus mawsoni TaxID=36200 RepID=A0A7J5ZDQ7_DISMA|nr:hypothetical protein F7725_012058 [Dissostichus mawsoni]